jgi:triosephosphate isomerase
MHKSARLKKPLFEIGLKAYLYGKDALDLARAADDISKKHNATIIFTPQYVDIPLIARETDNLLIFAQHIDDVAIGRGNGSVLAEAVKEAGAHGTWLNHAEKRLTLNQIENCVKRADSAGLISLVCADSTQQAAAVAHFHPNIVAAEPPELIDQVGSVGKSKFDFISQSINVVKDIDSDIIFFYGAGIRTAKDVVDVISTGAEGTGTTSGIINADNPVEMLEEMIVALMNTW